MGKMRQLSFALCLMCASMFSGTCFAQDEAGEQDEQKVEGEAAADRVFSALGALEALIEAESAKFYADCLRLIPSGSICGCLRDKRPAVVDFQQYVITTYQEGEILARMAEFSEDDQKVIRATIDARDKCAQ